MSANKIGRSSSINYAHTSNSVHWYNPLDLRLDKSSMNVSFLGSTNYCVWDPLRQSRNHLAKSLTFPIWSFSLLLDFEFLLRNPILSTLRVSLWHSKLKQSNLWFCRGRCESDFDKWKLTGDFLVIVKELIHWTLYKTRGCTNYGMYANNSFALE